MLRYAGTCESLYFPIGQTAIFLTGYNFSILYSSVTEYLHKVIGKYMQKGICVMMTIVTLNPPQTNQVLCPLLRQA